MQYKEHFDRIKVEIEYRESLAQCNNLKLQVPFLIEFATDLYKTHNFTLLHSPWELKDILASYEAKTAKKRSIDVKSALYFLHSVSKETQLFLLRFF